MPIIKLGGPVGSAAAEGAQQAPTWAGLLLEQQREQRLASLQALAAQEHIEDRLRQRHQEQAASEAMSQLVGLGTRTQEMAQSGTAARHGLSVLGVHPQNVSQTQLLDGQLEQIARRAHASGASPELMRQLVIDGGELLQRSAAQEDLQKLDQHYQQQAGYDPIAQATYERLKGQLVGVQDPDTARAIWTKTYSEELQLQTQLAHQSATSQMLDSQIQAVTDPTGPYAQLFQFDDGTARARLLESLFEAKAKNGAPVGLLTDQYRMQAQALQAHHMGRMGVTGRAADARAKRLGAAEPSPLAAPRNGKAHTPSTEDALAIADMMQRARRGEVSPEEVDAEIERRGIHPGEDLARMLQTIEARGAQKARGAEDAANEERAASMRRAMAEDFVGVAQGAANIFLPERLEFGRERPKPEPTDEERVRRAPEARFYETDKQSNPESVAGGREQKKGRSAGPVSDYEIVERGGKWYLYVGDVASSDAFASRNAAQAELNRRRIKREERAGRTKRARRSARPSGGSMGPREDE